MQIVIDMRHETICSVVSVIRLSRTVIITIFNYIHQGGYVYAQFVCWIVCQQDFWKSCEWILIKFLETFRKNNHRDCGDDLRIQIFLSFNIAKYGYLALA